MVWCLDGFVKTDTMCQPSASIHGTVFWWCITAVGVTNGKARPWVGSLTSHLRHVQDFSNWLVVWNITFNLNTYIGNSHLSWWIFSRGVETTNQQTVVFPLSKRFRLVLHVHRATSMYALPLAHFKSIQIGSPIQVELHRHICWPRFVGSKRCDDIALHARVPEKCAWYF